MQPSACTHAPFFMSCLWTVERRRFRVFFLREAAFFVLLFKAEAVCFFENFYSSDRRLLTVMVRSVTHTTVLVVTHTDCTALYSHSPLLSHHTVITLPIIIAIDHEDYRTSSHRHHHDHLPLLSSSASHRSSIVSAGCLHYILYNAHILHR